MARRRRRGFEQFSMSFLDVMSCGLGAVVLLFMIINHATEVRATSKHRDIATQVSMLESEILEKRQAKNALAAALRETEQSLRAARAQAASLEQVINREDDSDQEVRTRRRNIAALEEELKAIEKQIETLREREGEGDATRTFIGEGRRQYLTGLDVGGNNILILLDASASMLAGNIVDVIRRRNMSDTRKLASEKWQRARETVDWLTTQVPASSSFQIYTFNTYVKPVLPGTMGQWQSASGGTRLTEAVRNIRQIIPENGTSLAAAFNAASQLNPLPDNIFLITDGLPTQDAGGNRRGTVSGRDRQRFFNDARDRLPRDVPVNVILFPLEGDPMASPLYWELSQDSGGTFMSPSRDWP